jgi:hypothetical protein
MGGWSGRCRVSLICAHRAPVTVGGGGPFCVSFLPCVVSGSFDSEDPASPRIYPSYYLVDIARAGEICHGEMHLKRMNYEY